ncbi:MAG: ABC transporter substrate-binding protein [Acetomicrobium sp.]|uniref:ABC transporter substrate-binding protein n=1 Tax=Acetomicrobium sp. TaxID=1872099 RepID=UPI0028714D0D|nr:ABC transporter substrate-binding protein [Acetomicrobium sp.]MDR9770573.1 ABC transporter substrate-binding protein [Acetomicrobium sp.]HOM97982.1 ABC transporter substrate-binding protein [Acetomicrobium sp.]
MRKRAIVLILAFLSCFFFATHSPAATPKDSLVIAADTQILISLDPAVCYETLAAQITEAGYSGLTHIDYVNGVLTPVPGLAESWEILEDGTKYVFHLRENARFSNGDPVTADDVVFSFQRLLSIYKSPAWLLEEIGLTRENMQETITKKDDRTVVLKTKPLAPNIILSILGGAWGGIVNKKVVMANEVNGDLGEAYLLDKSVGAGAGPYEIVEWKRNDHVLLRANQYFWAGVPAIKQIFIKDVPESTTQFLLVQKGDVDVAWRVTTEQAAQLRDSPQKGVKLIAVPSQSNEYIAMNAQWGPFKDERVVKAVKYAIDYDAIINSVLRGFAVLNQNFIPIGYFGYIEMNPYKKDVAKAKQLLKDAGYPDGFEVEILTNPTQIRMDEAVLVQSNFAEVGIKATVTTMPASEMYAKFRQQGHQIILAGWGIDYPDPDALAKPFANYRVKQLAWRTMWYDDHAADLAEKAGLELNEERRLELYKELQEYWIEKSPFVMLYQPLDFWVIRDNVLGFEDAAAGYSITFDFTKISKK